MTIAKLILTISIGLIGFYSNAQIDIAINESDSMKSLEYNFYKVKTKNNKIIKSKPTVLFDGYPIWYPTSKLFFDKDGLLVKEDRSDQTDTTYYNSANQKIKMVLYPKGKNDSITFSYSYDSLGNIETIRKKSSAPKMDFSLERNHYSYEALVDEFYENFYLSEDDPDVANQFEAIIPEQNHSYRLYNDENELVEQKNLYGSRIRTIKYHYNDQKEIVKISRIDKETDSKGKVYISTETEEHRYSDDGLLHQVNHFSNDKLYREELLIYNAQGVLKEHTNQWFGIFNRMKKYEYDSNGDLIRFTFTNPEKDKIIRKITLKYTYNDRGDWVKCIHFDKKNRARYWIERMIEYY
jgi:RNA binding exosome subunit